MEVCYCGHVRSHLSFLFLILGGRHPFLSWWPATPFYYFYEMPYTLFYTQPIVVIFSIYFGPFLQRCLLSASIGSGGSLDRVLFPGLRGTAAPPLLWDVGGECPALHRHRTHMPRSWRHMTLLCGVVFLSSDTGDWVGVIPLLTLCRTWYPLAPLASIGVSAWRWWGLAPTGGYLYSQGWPAGHIWYIHHQIDTFFTVLHMFSHM